LEVEQSDSFPTKNQSVIFVKMAQFVSQSHIALARINTKINAANKTFFKSNFAPGICKHVYTKSAPTECVI